MKNQQGRRSYVHARDKHGRLWGVKAETSRGKMHAVGPFEPIGWKAPWIPPRQYLDLVQRDFQPAVEIDYDRMLADFRLAEREYQRRARRVGQKLHGQKFDAKAPPTQQMIEEIGFPPTAWQLVQASMKGDRYILGLTEKLNAKVAKYLPQPEDELGGFSDADLDLGGDEDEEEEDPTPTRTPRRRELAGAGSS